MAAGSLRRSVVWHNVLLTTPACRRAHVEFFSIPGELGVLHVCLLPRFDQALPVFGFDVIVGESKATGCFLDLSPSTPAAEDACARWGGGIDRAVLGSARILPAWAAIFSPHVVAVHPRDDAEITACLSLGSESLNTYVLLPAPAADPREMHAAQCRYVAAQREVGRTLQVLSGCVGAGLAEAFVREVLFADPPAHCDQWSARLSLTP